MAAAPETVTRSTTLSELRSPQPAESRMPTVRAGFSELAGFELAQRAAKVLSASTLVPENYRGNLADCIVALELAQRIGASPLMVMQNLYIVHGKPAWSSQFLIAAVNQCGRYTALQYEWSGERGKDSWTCRAVAKDKSNGERVQGPAVSIAMAKEEGWHGKKGSKWQTIPELMLMYRAATFFARTNAPELTMGLVSEDEARDVIEVHGDRISTEDIRPATPAPEASAAPSVVPAAKEEALYTDEVHALLAIDAAANRDAANEVVDACRGQPFYAKVCDGYNKKWAEVVK